MGVWDKDKPTSTDPDELYNEEVMEGIFEGTGLTELDLDQDPKAGLRNIKGNFD